MKELTYMFIKVVSGIGRHSLKQRNVLRLFGGLFFVFFRNFERIFVLLGLIDQLLIMNILHMQVKRIINTLKNKHYRIKCGQHVYNGHKVMGVNIDKQI